MPRFCNANTLDGTQFSRNASITSAIVFSAVSPSMAEHQFSWFASDSMWLPTVRASTRLGTGAPIATSLKFRMTVRGPRWSHLSTDYDSTLSPEHHPDHWFHPSAGTSPSPSSNRLLCWHLPLALVCQNTADCWSLELQLASYFCSISYDTHRCYDGSIYAAVHRSLSLFLI